MCTHMYIHCIDLVPGIYTCRYVETYAKVFGNGHRHMVSDIDTNVVERIDPDKDIITHTDTYNRYR